MDILQIFLVISLVLLTTLLVFLGIQLYHVLKEVQLMLRSLQRTLDNVAELSDLVKNPVSSLTQIKGWSSVLSGLREGVKLYKTFRRKDE